MMNNQALYVHVPWCRRRCPYCDFYFVVGKPEQTFLAAIKSEFEARSSQWLSGPAHSLYFGGGTPSMLEVEQIHDLIQYFIEKKALKEDAEITLEANPEDISVDYAKALAKSALNRLSLGVQSFENKTLRRLGRMHTSEQAWMALARLQEAGLSNISVDLIVGVPGEDQELLLRNLANLVQQQIPHFSPYLLTIEERTNFYKRIKAGTMQAPSEDHQVTIYRAVQKMLKSFNYIQYDISSYGLWGSFSRHNQTYWAAGSYLGLGPGAHSMRYGAEGIERAHCTRPLAEWLHNPSSSDNFAYEQLSPPEALKESLAFGLRNLARGIAPAELSLLHACPLPEGLERAVTKLHNYGWLQKENDCLFISEEGTLFADAIMSEILSC